MNNQFSDPSLSMRPNAYFDSSSEVQNGFKLSQDLCVSLPTGSGFVSVHNQPLTSWQDIAYVQVAEEIDAAYAAIFHTDTHRDEIHDPNNRTIIRNEMNQLIELFEEE